MPRIVKEINIRDDNAKFVRSGGGEVIGWVASEDLWEEEIVGVAEAIEEVVELRGIVDWQEEYHEEELVIVNGCITEITWIDYQVK